MNVFIGTMVNCKVDKVYNSIAYRNTMMYPKINDAPDAFFPNSVLSSCRFHFGQAWFRKIQKCGLSNEFKEISTDRCCPERMVFGFTTTCANSAYHH
jgi:hypothetical protein